MQFTDATKIYAVIEQMRKAEILRALNRTRIDNLFNGFPPYSEAEVQENKIQTNVNFLEPAKIAHDARTQFNNAYLSTPRFFSVDLNYGKEHERSEWAKTITKHINTVMKDSKKYMEMSREKFAQVVLHGIGPVIWENKDKWCPNFAGIGDLLIPSKTLVGMGNLEHFALYQQFTLSELYQKTHGPKVDPGWNVQLVEGLIAVMAKADGISNATSADYRFPEKLAEDIKANPGYYESDACPTANCWDFYFRNDDEKGKEQWHRRILLDDVNPTSAEGGPFSAESYRDKFLFNPEKRVYADSLNQILQIQFADGNNVAPFRYHSVRSLGFMLYAVCHLQNRIRNRLVDATFEALLTLFRNVSAEDRERLEMVDLTNFGIIPQGIEYVPGNERYTVDPNLIAATMSQNRQSMSDNSASFVQDVDTGTKQGITATEAAARITTANSLVSGMLQLSYTYEGYQYQEICRRFCIKKSSDNDVLRFRRLCLESGVPEEALDSSLWTVNPEQTLGNGNKMIRIAAAQQLMAIRAQLDPEGQRRVTHIYVDAISDIPNLANQIVPMAGKPISDATQMATLAIGTLLQALPVALSRSINRVDYVETLLQLLATKLKQYEATKKIPDQMQIAGLAMTIQHIGQNIEILSQDPDEEQRVKMYGDVLGRLSNLVEEFAQQFQEQAQKSNPGIDPETLGKISGMQILAQSKAKINEALAAQKLMNNQKKFNQSQGQKAVQGQQQMSADIAKLYADLMGQDMVHKSKILQNSREAAQPVTTTTE